MDWCKLTQSTLAIPSISAALSTQVYALFSCHRSARVCYAQATNHSRRTQHRADPASLPTTIGLQSVSSSAASSLRTTKQNTLPLEIKSFPTRKILSHTFSFLPTFRARHSYPKATTLTPFPTFTRLNEYYVLLASDSLLATQRSYLDSTYTPSWKIFIKTTSPITGISQNIKMFSMICWSNRRKPFFSTWTPQSFVVFLSGPLIITRSRIIKATTSQNASQNHTAATADSPVKAKFSKIQRFQTVFSHTTLVPFHFRHDLRECNKSTKLVTTYVFVAYCEGWVWLELQCNYASNNL